MGCLFLPNGATAFGIESALPILQDLHTHLPAFHHAAVSAVSTHADPHTGIIQLSHSISSMTSANNLLASSNDGTIDIANAATSLFNDYKHALDENPLQVKIITGCSLAVVGDAIAQSVAPGDYNKKRAAAFVVFDAVWRTVQQVTYGPIIQTCNGAFSAALLGHLPLSNIQDRLLNEDTVTVLGAIEQTLVSQLLLIPLLYYPIFYAVTGFVQSLTPKQTITRAQETFIQLMKRNLLFWIPVQFGAFYFVEENLQIPVLTACGLIWTVILSLSAGNVNTSSEEEKENTISAGAIEEKMVLEAGATNGVAGRSFFFGSKKSAYDESSEFKKAGSFTLTKTKARK